MKKYQLGIDNSYNGFCVLSQGNKIIDICSYPAKLKNKEVNELKKQLKDKNIDFFCQRYNKNFKSFGKTLEKQIKQEIKDIDFQCTREYDNLKQFFDKYANKISICYIEKPLQQTAMATTINSIIAGYSTLEVYRYLLTTNNVPYKILSISEWRKQFDYKEIDKTELLKHDKKDHYKIKKEHVKKESIRIAGQKIANIKQWYIPKGCKNINDGICEAGLLSILSI